MALNIYETVNNAEVFYSVSSSLLRIVYSVNREWMDKVMYRIMKDIHLD